VAFLVITTCGSYGDLYPYIGLGRVLAGRGHRVRLAAPAYYRPLVEQAGLEHCAVGPDVDPDDRVFIARVMDPVHGPEVLVREWLMSRVEQTYAELDAASRGADLLVSHPVTFAAPVLARTRSLPWVSTVLAPMSFFSVSDPPVLAGAPGLAWLRHLGPIYGRTVRWLADRATRAWSDPLFQLRRTLGVDDRSNPLMEGQYSPMLTLAMFSSVLASPQPDWPARVVRTGFVFYNGADGLSSELEAFLDAGDPPVVFTLGSSAVGAAGRFYAESAAAVRQLGIRAVLLTGGIPENSEGPASPDILRMAHAPHQLLFPRASVVVHHGGVGTTGQGLRAGRPALIVPHAHDQADNALRLVRLGVARCLPPARYTEGAVVGELRRLLGGKSYRVSAARVERVVRSEGGADAAALEIERCVNAAVAPAPVLSPDRS